MFVKKCLSLLLAVLLCFSCFGCGKGKARDYVLTEDTFFLLMTNMQYYPEQYLDSKLEFDCFTYALTDVNGQTYICGVRKSSAEYGCTCGRDTIIGFVLESAEPLPEPRNQSADNGDKTWVHLTGKLKSAEKTEITIHAYRDDGTIDPDRNEVISFLSFEVASCDLIEDASGLQYYVIK